MEQARQRPDTTLDEQLTRIIQESLTGTPRFRFPVKAEDAYRLLCSCYAAAVRYRCREFEPSSFTLDKIWQLALWVTSETPKFGAVMSGTVGNGKTTMLYAFQQAVNYLNSKSLFKDADGATMKRGMMIVTAKELCLLARNDWDGFTLMRDHGMLGIDELGEEPRLVKDYGNDISPVIDLIEHRYNKQLFTLVTTNLAPKQIEQEYGTRVADRFREMFEPVSFGTEKSFRN